MVFSFVVHNKNCADKLINLKQNPQWTFNPKIPESFVLWIAHYKTNKMVIFATKNLYGAIWLSKGKLKDITTDTATWS